MSEKKRKFCKEHYIECENVVHLHLPLSPLHGWEEMNVMICDKTCIYFKVQESAHRKYIPSDIFPTRYNITPFIYFWKTALHMFRVVSPPIIRNIHNCFYRIWYLLKLYCYLRLLWMCWSSNSSTIVAGSSNGLTSTRYCKYSCVCS